MIHLPFPVCPGETQLERFKDVAEVLLRRSRFIGSLVMRDGRREVLQYLQPL
jgi:hypothetical protein